MIRVPSPLAPVVIPNARLCENSLGALRSFGLAQDRQRSARTVKDSILLTPRPVRAEATRSMDGVFRQSDECGEPKKDFSPVLETRISPGVYTELARRSRNDRFSVGGRWV